MMQEVAEHAFATGLRAMPIIGDAFEPRLRSGLDYVLLAPVEKYQGPGIYYIEVHPGAGELYRVEPSFEYGDNKLKLTRDNGNFMEFCIPIDWFNLKVMGIVAAEIRVQNEHFLAA
ncbi:hypothetical protein V6767_20050 [Martelella sp. FLE1502]